MIKLYYTSVSAEDEQQLNPSLSLGGYKSSSLVPNDDLNNLFGDISLMTLKQFNRNQYIGLVIKNEDSDKTNINIWVSSESTPFSTFKLSVVSMVADSNGFKQFENIPTINSKPLLSDFQVYDVDNKFDVGDMVVGDVYGLWVERVIDVDAASEDLNDVYEEDTTMTNRFKEKTKETEDQLYINISWD